MTVFVDLLKNEIHVGDIVAVAATVNQSGELRIGTVDELIPLKIKIRVEWHRGFGPYGNTRKTMLGGHNERIDSGQKDVRGYTLWTNSGRISMDNFLVLDKAAGFRP